jgi:hypothetical protein
MNIVYVACEAEQMDTTPAAEEEAVKVTFESENAIDDASDVEEQTNGNDQGEVKEQQSCNAFLPGVYSLRTKRKQKGRHLPSFIH